MSDNWHERELARGRLLIRGYLDPADPLAINVTLYARYTSRSRGRHSPVDLLAAASYHSDSGGSLLSFFTNYDADQSLSWQRVWEQACRRQEANDWPAIPHPLWEAKKTVVITTTSGSAARRLGMSHPQLLVHYGCILQALQSYGLCGLSVGEDEERNALLQKMRGLVAERQRAWSAVLER